MITKNYDNEDDNYIMDNCIIKSVTLENNGQLRRDGLPSADPEDSTIVIYADGTEKWFRNGQLHRDGDLPAIIQVDGTQEWYQHGKLHRDNDLL